MRWAGKEALAPPGGKAEPGVATPEGLKRRLPTTSVPWRRWVGEAESRKATDVSEEMADRTRWASSGFEDLKLGSLTSGFSGERSESAATRG